MRSDEYLSKICMRIYEDMYSETKPRADIHELIESGITKRNNWFNDYYLSLDRQREIVDYWCKKYKCSKRERQKIENEIWLGCSPTSSKKKRKK